MEGLHQIFHVLSLIAFLGAVAVAFVGFAAPVLFPGEPARRGRVIKGSLLILVAALAGLAADWLAHNLA